MKQIPAAKDVIDLPTGAPYVKSFYNDFLHSVFNVRIKDSNSCDFMRNVQCFTWELLRLQNVHVAITILPAENDSDVIFAAELIDPDSIVEPDIRLHCDGVLLDQNTCLAEYYDRHFIKISQKCSFPDLCFYHDVDKESPYQIKNLFPTIKCKHIPQPVFDEEDWEDFLPDLPAENSKKSKINKVVETNKYFVVLTSKLDNLMLVIYYTIYFLFSQYFLTLIYYQFKRFWC